MIMSIVLTIFSSVNSDKNILESLPNINTETTESDKASEPSIPDNN